MIRLFRKIRKQLLAKDKYPIYMLYAGGEILLVVIGILLALQIDNWNKERIERNTQHNYLKGLFNELRENESSLQFEIDLADQRIEQGRRLKSFIHEDSPIPDTAEFILGVVHLGIFSPFQSFLPTFEDLKSSGNLHIIINDEIKLQIHKLIRRTNLFPLMLYNKNQEIKDAYNDLLFEYISPESVSLFWEYGLLNSNDSILLDLADYDSDLSGLKTSTELTHRINRVIGTERELKTWYEILKVQNLDPLIKLVEEELNKNQNVR